MDQDELGSRLKAAREGKGFTLRALASKIGVSSSLLSQIENGKTKPSVDTLYAVVRQLDISIDAILGLAPPAADAGAEFRPQTTFLLQTMAEAPVIEMENGVRWERLAVLPGLDIEGLRVTYRPSAASSVEGKLMQHLGYEHIAMVSGELTLRLEFDEHVITAGDTMAFDSQRPHMFVNRGTEDAVGIWYIVGRKSQSAAGDRYTMTAEHGAGGGLSSAIDVMHSFRVNE